jgi:hypothetical protein
LAAGNVKEVMDCSSVRARYIIERHGQGPRGGSSNGAIGGAAVSASHKRGSIGRSVPKLWGVS